MRSEYQLYPSLLDAYQDYLDAESRWEKFYGGSDDPSVSCDDYVEKSRRELIDKINRVPFESDAADCGTAFNILVDLVSGNGEKEDDFSFVEESDAYTTTYKGKVFTFCKNLVNRFASFFSFSACQYKCVGQIETKYGAVTLYGYIDELLCYEIHDIKTTSKYEVFKFRNHWQHIVYPYCIRYEGYDVSLFQYDVVLWGKGLDDYKIYKEVYDYREERDSNKLREHCEGLIEFIQFHRDEITDKKIFNCLDGQDEMIEKYGE